MIPIRFHSKMVAISLAAIVLIFCRVEVAAASDSPAAGTALLTAICPVVYPLDQLPTERGYRYLFYGNAFFINEEGYLITAAHVVKSFRDGGRPYILVGTPGGGHRLQETELIAEDREHDVAVLRTTTNPFVGQHSVTFMPMTAERPSTGKPVIAVSLLPSILTDSHTSDPPVEIRLKGQIIDYQFYAENEEAQSELLLFNQKVVPGQSGSPVVSADSGEVVGIVIGQWLNPPVIHFSTTAQPIVMSQGAALRIHYALALLRRHGILWHAALAAAVPPSPAPQTSGFSPPVPVSLVATPYPAQALFGSEVVLDALIDREGRIADLTVVRGFAPFLEPVLNAVGTWTFSPARIDGSAVETRMGIVFQFPQSFLPKLTARERKYDPPSDDSADHGALPVSTMEPDYPPKTVAEGSVILYNLVDPQGQVTSTRVLSDVEPLTAATLAASQQWRFVPGKQAGANTDSEVVLVVTFRHP